MNFYWRQTIVGLLHHVAEEVPPLGKCALAAADEVDRAMTRAALDSAFELFQQAASATREPVYVTGAYYAMQALADADRYEHQADGPAGVRPGGPSYEEATRAAGARLAEARPDEQALPETPGGPLPPVCRDVTDHDPHESSQPNGLAQDADSAREVSHGLLELFDRIRAGASLDQALALFPLVGEESNPYD